MKGFLWRKWKAVGSLFGGFETRAWEKYWFELKGGFLYYGEQKSGQLNDFICLKDATTQIFVHRSRMYCFEISHPERRTIYLEAKDDDEKYEWIRAISTAAAGPINPPATASMYYKVLGVDKKADLRDIQRAYRKMALKSHPDKGGDPEQFKLVVEAYEVLTAIKETEMEEERDYKLVDTVFKGKAEDFGFRMKGSGKPPLCRLLVSKLAQRGQAARLGVKTGDILIKVQGRGVRGFPFKDVKQYMEQGVQGETGLSFLRKKPEAAKRATEEAEGEREREQQDRPRDQPQAAQQQQQQRSGGGGSGGSGGSGGRASAPKKRRGDSDVIRKGWLFRKWKTSEGVDIV
jgi:curved DNA-binding protein CbpA